MGDFTIGEKRTRLIPEQGRLVLFRNIACSGISRNTCCRPLRFAVDMVIAAATAAAIPQKRPEHTASRSRGGRAVTGRRLSHVIAARAIKPQIRPLTFPLRSSKDRRPPFLLPIATHRAQFLRASQIRSWILRLASWSLQ